jgi:coenzyme F420-reducing hydrogenase delta subunit
MSHRPLKTYVFYCSNHLQADQFASMVPGPGMESLKTISLPCSGKIDIPYLIKAFETGADAVVLVRCKTNECRHFEGNLRAHKRAQAVSALLEEIGCDGRRITVFECPQDGAGQVLGQINQFLDTIKNLPQTSAFAGVVVAKESTVA